MPSNRRSKLGISRRALLSASLAPILACGRRTATRVSQSAPSFDRPPPVSIAVAQTFGVGSLESLLLAGLSRGIRDGALHPDTKVRTFNLVNSASGTLAEPLETLAAEAAVDIVIFPGRDLIDLSSAALLVPFQGSLAEVTGVAGGHWRWTLQAVTVNDAVMALPAAASPWLLLYNPAVLDSAGVEPPPETGWDWTQFRESVARVNRAGPVGLHLVQPSSPGGYFMPPIYVWLGAAGVEFVTDRKSPESLLDGKAERAVSLLHQLIITDDSTTSSASGTRFGAGIQKLILNQNLGMLCLGISAAHPTELWHRVDDPHGFEVASFPHAAHPVTPAEVDACIGVCSLGADHASAAHAARLIEAALDQTVYLSARRSRLRGAGARNSLSDQRLDVVERLIPGATAITLTRAERRIIDVYVGFKGVRESGPEPGYLEAAASLLSATAR